MEEGSKSVEDITRAISELTVRSFSKLEDVKMLAKHLQYIKNHPDTQKNAALTKYLSNLEDIHKGIYLQKRDGVVVEFIFTTEKKSNLQRQRFNSLPVSEVPDLLKNEFLNIENAQQVHICTDCDVEIELNDDLPLMESLQRHFNLEIHQPKPKPQLVDVSERVRLPLMSRRMSALDSGELPVNQRQKISEEIDRGFLAKLETCLVRYLPDNSEASIDAAVKFHQNSYEKLCAEASFVPFRLLLGTVSPIILSIKENVNQYFAPDANKNYENDENDQNLDRSKNQVKKFRYYAPIENVILKLLTDHKILSLTDDRTGKLAFFCIACEYYTLRFRYDSVLSHIFSETHKHNLSCILDSDKHIPFVAENRTVGYINEINAKFLSFHNITNDKNAFTCGLCKVNLDNQDTVILHVLEENHLGKLSDKLYRKAKANNDNQTPEDWGQKSVDWTKYLAGTGKALTNRDPLIIENFIKPSGKIANYCSCCDMNLKGPRQVLFSHVRQKKHIRNSAPHKLSLLYKNYCRPAEYYASFGNCYVCVICPKFTVLPSFAAIVEHFESPEHVKALAKMIKTALYKEYIDQEVVDYQKIQIGDEVKCLLCNESFESIADAMHHSLSDVKHQNLLIESKIQENKGDIISAYMKGNFILHREGSSFHCVVCNGVFNSLRSIIMHLVYAQHFNDKPGPESAFRFYLELKHNIKHWARNKFEYYDFGKMRCNVCDCELCDNARTHGYSLQHKQNMGSSYINVTMDDPQIE